MSTFNSVSLSFYSTIYCTQKIGTTISNFLIIFYSNYIKITFPEIDGEILCWLQIKKADKRVFIKTKQKGDMFFIRTDAETREITGQELVDYCERRFK